MPTTPGESDSGAAEVDEREQRLVFREAEILAREWR